MLFIYEIVHWIRWHHWLIRLTSAILMTHFWPYTVCVLYEWKRSYACFLIVSYRWISNYQEGKGGNPINRFNPTIFLFLAQPWTWISHVTWLEPTIYHTRVEHAIHYATDAVEIWLNMKAFGVSSILKQSSCC